MKKIRVLVVVNRLDYGGVESLLAAIQKNIDSSKFELLYLCIQNNASRADAYVETIERYGGKVIFYRCSAADIRNYRMRTVRDIKKIIIDNKIDCIHCHHQGSFLAALVGRLYGRPVIVHSHSAKFYWPSNLVKRIMYAPVNLTNLVVARYLAVHRVAVGRKAGAFLFNRKPYQILSNGIDLDDFSFSRKSRSSLRKELNVALDDTVMLHVGRMAYPKNQRFVVDIFSKFIKLRPKSKLVMVGDGPDFEGVKRHIHELRLDECTRVMGSRQDISRFYSAADILLLPSFFEGMPMTLIESQANGLRCLISDTVDPAIRLTKSLDFFSIRESPESWAKKIDSMNIDRTTGDTLKDSDYDVVATARSFEDMYKEVVRGE